MFTPASSFHSPIYLMKGEQIVCRLVEFIYGNGGMILDDNQALKIDSPEAVDALQMMIDLVQKEKITPLAAVEAPHLGAGDGHIVARDALVELGYSLAEAEQRLSDTDPDLPPAERVRQALRAA